MRTRTEQLDFIRLNLNALAYCAWQGFQAKGRGLVCVLCDDHNEATRTVPFDFLPASEAEKLIPDWTEAKEARLVAEYDPKLEVVVLFVQSGKDRSDVDAYRFQPRPAPPEAEEP